MRSEREQNSTYNLAASNRSRNTIGDCSEQAHKAYVSAFCAGRPVPVEAVESMRENLNKAVEALRREAVNGLFASPDKEGPNSSTYAIHERDELMAFVSQLLILLVGK